MSGRFIIYALVDPRDGAWRYIGKSSFGLKRPKEHLRDALAGEQGWKANWIRKLIRFGLTYSIEVVEELASESELSDAEMEWIAAAHRTGCNLTNRTDGGDGASGFKHSPSTRQRLKEIALARPPMSAETRERHRVASTGRRHSYTSRRKMCERQQAVLVNKKIARGSRHGNAKLSDKIVREIRKVEAPNFAALGRVYGLRDCSIHAAYFGKTWKHVKDRVSKTAITEKREQRIGRAIKASWASLSEKERESRVAALTARSVSWWASASSEQRRIRIEAMRRGRAEKQDGGKC